MNKLIKLISAIFILSVILNVNNFALGQDEAINNEVKDLNSEISDKRSRLEELQKKQKDYSSAIQKKQKEQANLNNQLSIIEDRIAKSEIELESAELEIDKTNLEIKKTNLEIDTKNREIEREKEHISNVLRIIYKQDQVSSLEILLMNDSLSDFLNEMKYLEDVNSEILNSVENLKDYKKQLEDQKINLDEKGKELEKLKADLESKKDMLASESDNKNYLLEQSENSESEYQRLLAQAKKEQLQASNDIANLEKTVRAKIADINDQRLEFNDNGLIWPVRKNTITSIFHDPDYPFKYIFEHPAVDIKAGQGTAIKAAASGYVARAKDAGKGYSYIMLVHGNGISTVYGHVSQIYVAEDEYVVQGQTIGLSGGMPGTRGAGPLTTGPHLHFEVRVNGIPANPLEYLP
ncbi:MAG: peptidoglycan DD-metalloendopeptidase family protein [Patescibacteria group bacterium]|nr:peptidoglycan DD-metalloendopeptidase family protein [Patescibacteria group bacterium]MDD4610337.1 peptidoglycan DD-metalloendopeptidase family protein [Patescibacteria group bacterium]